MPKVNDFAGKSYLAIVQCHTARERCPGFFCERSLFTRTDGFAQLPKDQSVRVVNITCGGCCGRALQRKLELLVTKAGKYDAVGRDQILVKFATCITRASHHGPRCPHLDYLVTLVDRLGLDYSFDTRISAKAERRRAEGLYSQ